ncbi:hypothetical protein SAY86_019496 [Trapa natans]|uniref:Glycosyltransferase n=1 Tax=Trapa natans TaxID=22666 RepID=A0AAN7R3B2_TRANT|nr:hypothetical protein SAY86_019496 [Trapa natans]
MPSSVVFVVTGSGQGHVHPCMELCRHLGSRDYHTTLVVPSSLSSAIPSSFSSHPFVSIAQITVPPGPPMPPSGPVAHQQAHQDLLAHLSAHSCDPSLPPALCAIVDFQLGWTKECFRKFQIPVISFFTFGACAAAMELGAWRAQASDLGPGESRPIVGLPEEMAVTYWDLKRKPMGPPRGSGAVSGGKHPGGPPRPGDMPPWVPQVEGPVGMMFNTCDDLERPFLEYMEAQMGMPAWGVGPLLPEPYWRSSDSLVRDGAVRQHTRHSNYSEEEVIQWLDRKPQRSVLYVAFGSEVGPAVEEYPELVAALEESSHPFIWAVQSKPGQPRYFPEGLDARVGDRGLVIDGWAPQLLILSHPSTGGFLSHCGWNSTAEAVGLGVPLLAWPIRGDQHYNAKLVVSHLRVGHRVADDLSENVKKGDILRGIEKLMGDEEAHERAARLKARFAGGFPASSAAALDAFQGYVISQKKG